MKKSVEGKNLAMKICEESSKSAVTQKEYAENVGIFNEERNSVHKTMINEAVWT